MGLDAASAGLVGVLAAWTGAWAAAPGGEPAAREVIALDVIGACPDRAEVTRLIAELVPRAPEDGQSVSVQDRGPHFRVAVGDRATTLEDPARDCAARARAAAVVVASELPLHALVVGPPLWTIEKGVVFDVAPGTEGPAWAPGAEFRGALGSGTWSLVGAAGARGPATLSFPGGWKADLLRFPLDAGVRATLYWGRFRPWLVLGGSLTPTAILGQEVVQTDRQWRLDVGALGIAGATLRVAKRIGLAAAINLRWQPRPYHLQVSPHGTVGETPAWWLGLSLNYTLDGQASRP
ncbi:MAG TPA: hypothetical protein VLT58_09000 [Polyangia bacterium]|nr:hypothetical protein [Polyangia bacterium]